MGKIRLALQKFNFAKGTQHRSNLDLGLLEGVIEEMDKDGGRTPTLNTAKDSEEVYTFHLHSLISVLLVPKGDQDDLVTDLNCFYSLRRKDSKHRP